MIQAWVRLSVVLLAVGVLTAAAGCRRPPAADKSTTTNARRFITRTLLWGRPEPRAEHSSRMAAAGQLGRPGRPGRVLLDLSFTPTLSAVNGYRARKKGDIDQSDFAASQHSITPVVTVHGPT